MVVIVDALLVVIMELGFTFHSLIIQDNELLFFLSFNNSKEHYQSVCFFLSSAFFTC